MSDSFFSRIKARMVAQKQESLIGFPQDAPIAAPHIMDARATSTGYLTGQLLVATPLVQGSCFHKAVIYIFSHSEEGAMGLVINQPLETIAFSALIPSLKLPESPVVSQISVYFGGPVERGRGFVLHSADYAPPHTLMQAGGVAVTASSVILQDIIAGKGPRHAALCVGYAGWSAGQIEQEIAENSWITIPATPSLVFGTEDELKWASCGKTLGIDMGFYSSAVGHA